MKFVYSIVSVENRLEAGNIQYVFEFELVLRYLRTESKWLITQIGVCALPPLK